MEVVGICPCSGIDAHGHISFPDLSPKMKLDPSSLLFACAAACLSTTGFSQADIPPEDWTKQIGTAAEDHTTGVAHDGAGGAFVSGSINATGNQQCYAARIGAQGQTVWQSILGSNSWLEETYGVLADGEGGCWVISKAHQASDWLAPGLSPGGSSYDGILLRYNSGGTLIVSTRIGDVWDNEPTAICSDGAGGVFVGGLDSGFGDIWLLRVDSQGTQLWFEDIDPPTGRIDELSSLCPDGAGGCYLGGAGGGDVFGPGSGLGSDDSILLRFDSAGNQTGGVQFGTSSRDKLYALALADNGDVFCGGTTLGSFGGPSAGSFDVFVSRMDSSLSTVWVRQFGSSGGEYPTTIGVRDDGSLVLAGLTGGALGGPSFGNVDAWLATMDASGAGLGLLQVGTNVPEFGGYVAVGSGEDVFLAGWSGGLFGAQQYGSTDLFVPQVWPAWARAGVLQSCDRKLEWFPRQLAGGGQQSGLCERLNPYGK